MYCKNVTLNGTLGVFHANQTFMCLDPHLQLNWFKPSCKIFLLTVPRRQGDTSFVDYLCYLCLVFVMLLRLFIAALWLPEGNGLTSWLLFVMLFLILLLSLLVSCDRCGT